MNHGLIPTFLASCQSQPPPNLQIAQKNLPTTPDTVQPNFKLSHELLHLTLQGLGAGLGGIVLGGISSKIPFVGATGGFIFGGGIGAGVGEWAAQKLLGEETNFVAVGSMALVGAMGCGSMLSNKALARVILNASLGFSSHVGNELSEQRAISPLFDKEFLSSTVLTKKTAANVITSIALGEFCRGLGIFRDSASLSGEFNQRFFKGEIQVFQEHLSRLKGQGIFSAHEIISPIVELEGKVATKELIVSQAAHIQAEWIRLLREECFLQSSDDMFIVALVRLAGTNRELSKVSLTNLQRLVLCGRRRVDAFAALRQITDSSKYHGDQARNALDILRRGGI